MRQFSFIMVHFLGLIVAVSVNAQISVGVKGGIHFADVRTEGISNQYLPEPQVYEGFLLGAVVEMPLMNGFSFRPELNFVQKGFRAMEEFAVTDIDLPVGAGMKTRLNYMEVPLLFKYAQGNDLAKWYVVAGPAISYATEGYVRPVVRAVIDFTLPAQQLNLDNDIYRRWDASVTGGLGGEVKAGPGKIFADIRYTHGLANVFNNPIVDVKVKNQGFTLSAGYAYTF